MKISKLLINATVLAAFFSAGCSLWPFGKSSNDEAPKQTGIIDAATLNKEPVKVGDKDVVDAGAYKAKDDYADIPQHGGKGAAVIPTEKFYSIDRDKYAPVGKMLYFLTDEEPARCIMAKFTVLNGRKKLMAYSGSPVPTNYCVYQKSFVDAAEGFSLWLKDGGICRPSFTEVTTDDQKRKIATVKEVPNTVSMSYCVDGTVSYGQEMARRTR